MNAVDQISCAQNAQPKCNDNMPLEQNPYGKKLLNIIENLEADAANKKKIDDWTLSDFSDIDVDLSIGDLSLTGNFFN